MKKLFLLSICAGLGVSAFAQSMPTIGASAGNAAHLGHNAASLHGRITSYTNDTEVLTNGVDPSTDTIYYVGTGTTIDSGFFIGQGLYGAGAFAQRYDFNSGDSSVQVLGTFTFLTGAVSTSSSNNMVFKAWSVGSTSAAASGTATYSGFPNTVLDSVSVPFTSLGLPIATVYDTADFYSINFFATPTAYLTSSFFVGCSMNYTWPTSGDTVGINVADFYPEPHYAISGGDTTINVQSATNFQGSWYDNGYDLGLPGDYFIFAIVNANVYTSVKGITNNNLSFFGNYPNPAADETNIKLSLANPTDVTVTILDMAGHVLDRIAANNLPAGVNIIPVNTSSLASGNYIYLVRTADNSGIGAKMTIVK